MTLYCLWHDCTRGHAYHVSQGVSRGGDVKRRVSEVNGNLKTDSACLVMIDCLLRWHVRCMRRLWRSMRQSLRWIHRTDLPCGIVPLPCTTWAGCSPILPPRAARQLLEVGIAACYTCASKTGHIRLGCQHGITQQEEHIRTMGAES